MIRCLPFAVLAALPLLAGTLPDGPGKDSVERLCSACHGLGIVTDVHRTADEWKSGVDGMKARGATGSNADFALALRYLTDHFGRAVALSPSPIESSVSAHVPRSTKPRDEWPAYANDPGAARFSPLTQINRDSVQSLAPAWTFDTGRHFEVTPIVVQGVMYLTTPTQRVIALEPESGRKIWEFDPKVTRVSAHRGVWFWPGDPPRILVATTDARLLILAADTGKLLLSVNLGAGSFTSPPAIYRNLAILGPELQEGPATARPAKFWPSTSSPAKPCGVSAPGPFMNS
jgi:quinoprotein glucose dehydrogenase